MRCVHYKYYIEAKTINKLAPRIILMDDLLNYMHDFTDVYKITITEIRAELYNIEKKSFDFYVANELKTVSQWDDRICQHADKCVYYPAKNHGASGHAVIDNIINHIDLRSGSGLVINKDIYWHKLNPEKDIVINNDLRQIYPLRTNDLPVTLKKLFQQKAR